VEAFLARPQPWILRILQNPNFYSLLIGAILVSAAFYIFVNQRAVGRHMTALLRGHFLMSKDAADPNDVGARAVARARKADEEKNNLAPADAPANDGAANAKDAAPTFTQMEIGFFELSRENLMALAGKILRDDGDWHVVYYDDAKTIESLQSAARKLPGVQEKTLQKETTQMDAGDIDPDLQSPYLAVGVEWKGESLHWALNLQLPSAAANTRTLAQAESGSPSESTTSASAPPLQLTAIEGSVRFVPQSALLLVYDPAVRTFPGLDRQQVTNSPLRVLASEDFRAGYSALVVWIRLK
jgi:hypothetical protein